MTFQIGDVGRLRVRGANSWSRLDSTQAKPGQEACSVESIRSCDDTVASRDTVDMMRIVRGIHRRSIHETGHCSRLRFGLARAILVGRGLA